jgi:hypothetical protein
VKLTNGRLIVQVPLSVKMRDQYVRAAVVSWYRERALEKLQEKVDRYAKIVRVNPSAVGIKTFRGRWASCTSSGRLEFNWKVIMAPNRVVDYVVVHELKIIVRSSKTSWQVIRRPMQFGAVDRGHPAYGCRGRGRWWQGWAGESVGKC